MPSAPQPSPTPCVSTASGSSSTASICSPARSGPAPWNAQRTARITLAALSPAFATDQTQREQVQRGIVLTRTFSHRLIPLYLDGVPDDPDGVPYGLGIVHAISLPDHGSLDDVAAIVARVSRELAAQDD